MEAIEIGVVGAHELMTSAGENQCPTPSTEVIALEVVDISEGDNSGSNSVAGRVTEDVLPGMRQLAF